MKKITFLFLLMGFLVMGQQPKSLTQSLKQLKKASVQKPIAKKADFFRISPPLREMIENDKREHRTFENNERENGKKNEQNEWHPTIINNGLNAPDPLSTLQHSTRNANATNLNKIIDFDGVNNIDGVAPPDTQGDVSPNHYMQCVNNHTIITDRNGNVIQAAFPTSDFWQGTQFDDRNDGDAVILWDENAQRWLVTQFYIPLNGNTNYLLIAVSQTSDPTGAYYQYGFSYGTDMPDYPKWAIWPDAYYMGANGFDQNSSYIGTFVSAFERDKILQGDPNAQVVTFGPDANLWSVFPADADAFPANGTPCPFVSDQVNNTNGNNTVYLYDFHVDWNNTGNSTFNNTTNLNVADFNLFNSGTEVPQPGTNQKLDLLHYRIMYRPYFRHFNDHESLLVTRTVNDNGIAAIRWYEFRNTGNGWNVYQQGTYNPGDGLWRWMPSIAMNQNGDITIAYSVSDGNNKYPSIRAVARYANDPLNQMTTNEIELFTGNASQDNVSRWGDYSMVSIDPDGTSFWFTTEYTTGNWDWRTRIIHYELPSTCNYPSTQASNIQASPQGQNQIDLSWTRGDGNKVIVLAKEASAVDSNPADGTSYNANSTFGTGDQIGTGNYVVYDGTGTSVSVTGLNSATTYHFAVYEYNTTDNCYLVPGATANATTDGMPTVETLAMLQVNDTDAQGQGNVISENGSAVTERGLCWSTNPNPTTADNYATNGTGTGIYTVNLTGLTVNQTYYVRAYATNAFGTAYGDNVSFITGCGNPITDFPYLENFDAWTESNPTTNCTADASVNFDDCWENISGDDNDWDVLSGATASSNTGPSDDANGGGKYIYLEASNCFNKTASFRTPHFNFSNIANPYMTFFAHMYGADMGTLEVFYTTDNGNNWTSIGSISGDQGDAWIKLGANLSSLSGQADVQFKFTGTTGNDYQSDIAIDNFVIKDYTPPADYCASEGNMDYNTAITRVNFNQISNNSGGKTNAYEDYTNISTIVKRGQNYNLSVNVDTDGNYTVYSKVWIDWNQDGDFDDAGEEYDLGNAVNVSDGATSNSPVSVVIPSNTVTGKTRMRVSAKYNNAPTACETGFDGEVEDYSVIVSSPNCSDVAYWDGAQWTDTNNNVLQLADLSTKLLITKDVLITNGQSIDACGLSVHASEAVTINTGDYINLTNDVINDGKIDIEDGGILVQSDNNASIEGNGIYTLTRYSQNLNNQYDYVYWASPIESFNLGDIVSNAWRYYTYDTGIQYWSAANNNTSMQPGIGYAVSAPLGFQGGSLNVKFNQINQKFNNGTIGVNININGTGAQDDDDWNLVGNPYPSPIDFNTLATDNTNIQGAYYLWTNCAGLDGNGNHQPAGYTIYSIGSGSIAACNGNGPSASRYVPATEGFFVEANASGTLNFKNDQRSTTQTNFVNRSNPDRAWFDLTNNLNFQQTLIGFFANATDQKDRLYDAHSINGDFDLYTLIGNEKFAIQGLSPWNNADRIVPLGFATTETGAHQIALNRTEGILSSDVNIYLNDTYENIITDLKANPYTFQTNQGRFDDRFEIIFTRNSLEVNEMAPVNNINLLSNDGYFTIISDNKNMSGVKIFGINGKLLKDVQNQKAVGRLYVNLNELPHQILIFKIILKDGTSVILKAIR